MSMGGVWSEGSVEVLNVQCGCTEPETWQGEGDQGQRGERENVGYGKRKWEAEGEKGRRMRKDAERAQWLRIRLHRTEYKGLPNAASPVGPVTLLTCLLTCVVFLIQPVAHCSLVGHGYWLSGGPGSYYLESDSIPGSYYNEYFWE